MRRAAIESVETRGQPAISLFCPFHENHIASFEFAHNPGRLAVWLVSRVAATHQNANAGHRPEIIVYKNPNRG